MRESLEDKILLLNIAYTKDSIPKVGYRMFFVKDKNFTRQGMFNWAEEEAEKVNGVITDLKII
jgi:hypothetical protein